jgi:hypothetical protein
MLRCMTTLAQTGYNVRKKPLLIEMVWSQILVRVCVRCEKRNTQAGTRPPTKQRAGTWFRVVLRSARKEKEK